MRVICHIRQTLKLSDFNSVSIINTALPKEMSKFFTIESGDQFVMMNGIGMKESSRVSNLDTKDWLKLLMIVTSAPL